MSDLVLNSILVGILIAILISIYRFHSDSARYRNFNLADLITSSDGHVSRPAVMELGTWVFLLWGMVVLINRATPEHPVPNEYFYTLAAFVLRGAWASWLATKGGNPPAPPPEIK